MRLAEDKEHKAALEGVSVLRGSLREPEEGSLRPLASAFVELAIQILRDEKEDKSMKEAA